MVWHHSIPSYLANEVERVQRRMLKIILPEYSYKKALIQLGCIAFTMKSVELMREVSVLSAKLCYRFDARRDDDLLSIKMLDD